MSAAEALELLNQLYKRFRVGKHAFYGDCLIIPEEQFDPDWDDALTQLTEVHGIGDYVYIKLPKDFIPKEAEVSKPDPKRAKPKKGSHKRWSEPEEALLIEIAKDKKLTMKQIYDEYDKKREKKWSLRSFSSVRGHISELRQEGKISYRYEPDKNEPPETQVHEEATVAPAKPEAPATEKLKPPSKEELMRRVIDEKYPYSVVIISADGVVSRIRKEDIDSWRNILSAVTGGGRT